MCLICFCQICLSVVNELHGQFPLRSFTQEVLAIVSLKMMRYWGELPGASAPPGRSSFDLLQREFRQVEMQDPPLHQPSVRRPLPTTMLDITSEPCSLTIHTLQLWQHARRLHSWASKPLVRGLRLRVLSNQKIWIHYQRVRSHRQHRTICCHWTAKRLVSCSSCGTATRRATSTSKYSLYVSWFSIPRNKMK